MKIACKYWIQNVFDAMFFMCNNGTGKHVDFKAGPPRL